MARFLTTRSSGQSNRGANGAAAQRKRDAAISATRNACPFVTLQPIAPEHAAVVQHLASNPAVTSTTNGAAAAEAGVRHPSLRPFLLQSLRGRRNHQVPLSGIGLRDVDSDKHHVVAECAYPREVLAGRSLRKTKRVSGTAERSRMDTVPPSVHVTCSSQLPPHDDEDATAVRPAVHGRNARTRVDLNGRDLVGMNEVRIVSYHRQVIKKEAPSAAKSRAGKPSLQYIAQRYAREFLKRR